MEATDDLHRFSPSGSDHHPAPTRASCSRRWNSARPAGQRQQNPGSWRPAHQVREKVSKRTVSAGDGRALLDLLAGLREKKKKRIGKPVKVVVIQEVGLDGQAAPLPQRLVILCQFVTRRFGRGIWRRRAAFALCGMTARSEWQEGPLLRHPGPSVQHLWTSPALQALLATLQPGESVAAIYSAC